MNRKLTQRFIHESLTNCGKCKTALGFTLIELLAVMVIILIIAGLFVGVSGPASKSAKKRKAEVMISALEVAICMYHADTGSCPPTGAGAAPNPGSQTLYDHLTNTAAYGTGGSSAITGWNGPYMNFKSSDISGGQILDPWETPYNYSYGAWTNNPYPGGFDIWSDGPNKTSNWGSVDDIKNW